MTLRSRLAAGLVLIAIVLVGPLVFGLRSLDRMNEGVRVLRDRDVPASLVLGRLREGLTDLRRIELAVLFQPNVSSREAMEKQVRLVGALADSLKRFALFKYSEQIGASIRQVPDASRAEYQATLASKTAHADSLSDKLFVPALNRADSTVRVAEIALRDRNYASAGEIASSIGQTERLSLVALILALVLAAILAYLLTRSISKP